MQLVQFQDPTLIGNDIIYSCYQLCVEAEICVIFNRDDPTEICFVWKRSYTYFLLLN